MAETTIGALTNLATATATDRGGVAALTQENSRLAKQLEDNSTELRELKALLNQERRDRMATRLVKRTRTALETPLNPDTKPRQLETITWEVVRPTFNV
jgi:chromosome segregation ATPase